MIPTRRIDAGRRRLSGWLLVGAVARNAGKTEFACAVIEAFHRRCATVGVKVTAIADGESACPRGNGGCGVCAGLVGDYDIVEEKGDNPGKDTARMLRSGAHRVFWVKSRRAQLPAALDALVERIGPGALVVAESNSLARVVEPDLFVMVQDARLAPPKATAAEVMPLADRLVAPAAGAFDLDPPRHLAVVGGAWHLTDASAAILAGGASSRMGQDKSLLALRGRPLIHDVHAQLQTRFDEILIGTNEPGRYAFLGATTVADRVPGRGPLMGIASVVAAARHERVFVTACDIPVVNLDLVAEMLVLAEAFDCVVPLSAAGCEPLFAVYRKSALPAMHRALDAGERRIRTFFPWVRTCFHPLGDASWYCNLNTREDVAAFLRAC